ncbi:MAG: radical SAM protein [Candidatus Edwardsbacteria bacterium]
MTSVKVKPYVPIVGKRAVLLLSRWVPSWILLNRDLYNKLQRGVVGEGLARKLYARGMASLRGETLQIPKKASFSPLYFVIDIADNCNLACTYCVRHPMKNHRLSDEKLREILKDIKNIAAHGNNEIFIQPFGGEPLLALDQILKIDEFFQFHGIPHTITIQTNGTLISLYTAKLMWQRGFQISLSIDGNKSTHDIHRITASGKGSFLSVLRGFNYLRDAGYPAESIGILTTLTRPLLTRLEEVVDFFVNSLGANSFRLAYPYLIRPQMAFDFVTPKEYAEVAYYLITIARNKAQEGKKLIEAALSSRVKGFLNNDIQDICWSGPCRMGYRMIAYDIEGNRYPCSELTGLQLYQIGHALDGLEEEPDRLERVISDFHRRSFNHLCDECIYLPWCGGGCRMWSIYGRFQNYSRLDYVCAFTKVVIDEVIQCMVDGKMDLLECLQ